MHIKQALASLIVAAALAATSPEAMAQKPISPLTEATINAYSDMIKEDPSDYISFFMRGNEYYNIDEYIKALDDINSALRYAPGTESDIRFQCYVTRANINERLHRYSDAVSDLNSALALSPDCLNCINMLGRMEFNLGNYSRAGELYQNLLRRLPRNRQAMFGLARVAVKENNYGLAAKYCDDAVEMAPNATDVYIERAAIRTMMNNQEGAVDDYIAAINLDDRTTGRALRSLVALSKTNYPAVINGLSRAVNAAPNSGAYLYLRASIAQAHGSYRAAISDLETIINNNLDGYAGLNYSLAECYYALGNYEIALTNIDYAIGNDSDNPLYYAQKAKIRNALADYEGALYAADKSLELNSDCTPALIEKAMAQVGLGKPDEASVTLAEAIMNEADDASIYLLRAWVSKELLGNEAVAKTLFERVLDIPIDFDRVESLRGFAQLMLGESPAAERWMNEVIETNEDSDGLVSYYAACLYARIGNTSRALAYMENSLRNGYANYHNWMNNTTGYVNVEPLRDLPEFKALMERFKSIF